MLNLRRYKCVSVYDILRSLGGSGSTQALSLTRRVSQNTVAKMCNQHPNQTSQLHSPQLGLHCQSHVMNAVDRCGCVVFHVEG